MRIYCVGGAVRDELLGLPVKDRDWVVVGATPEMLIERGFQPVGRDFPVFLHPKTHEEYALARTERKTAPGYRGFAVHYAPDVTLEDDLLRRDLTINAMARDADGTLIDPHGGLADLRAGVLRHVGAAFTEDPVRILRLARFAARFDRFVVAPETMALMRRMVEHGEADALVAERVWQEISRGLMERHPSRMFAVLRDCGALARIVPEVDRLWGVPQPPEHHPEIDTGAHVMMAIDHAAAVGATLPVRFATLLHDVGKGVTPRDQWPRHPGHEEHSARIVDELCERLRAPVECRDLARLVAREHELMHRALELRAGTLTRLLERLDVLRKPQRLEDLIAACESDWRGRLGFGDRPWPQAERLRLGAQAMRSVDAGAIAAAHAGSATGIREAIHAARVAAVSAAIAGER
ncbi:MAG: multifunctional CCA addition/repair protein [Burkholderiaceae bacterium]|nr:multifunctional CCA addition/repair protein [Burkholderiaceae bacterium]